MAERTDRLYFNDFTTVLSVLFVVCLLELTRRYLKWLKRLA